MSIVYTLVPREIARGMVPAPNNLDEYIVEKAKSRMKNINRGAKNKSDTYKAKTYMAQLRNMIKTKKEVAERPIKVTLTDPKTELEKKNQQYRQPDEAMKQVHDEAVALESIAAHKSKVPKKRSKSLTSHPMPESHSSGTSKPTVFLNVGAEDSEEPEIVIPAPKPAPVPTSTSKAAPKPTRSNSVKLTDEKFMSYVAEVVEFLQEQPIVYGIAGNKVLKDDNTEYSKSDLKGSIEYLLAGQLGKDHGGVAPAGTVALTKRLNSSQDFLSFLDQVRQKAQTGGGQKRKKSKKKMPLKRLAKTGTRKATKNGNREVAKKIGSNLNRDVIAAMKRPYTIPLQIGRGRKRKNPEPEILDEPQAKRRGRPREKPKQRPFRVERWKRPNR